MQVYLELAKTHINQFELLQIVKLSRCLMYMDSTHQTSLLLQGLKLLCKERGTADDIRELNADELIWYLAIFGGEISTHRLLVAVETLLDNLHELKPVDYLVLLRGLLNIKNRQAEVSKLSKLRENIHDLETDCIKVLRAAVVEFKNDEILMTQELCNASAIYCSQLHIVISEIACEKFSLREQLRLLDLFWAQACISEPLMQCAFRNLRNELSTLETMTAKDSHRLLSALAQSVTGMLLLWL